MAFHNKNKHIGMVCMGWKKCECMMKWGYLHVERISDNGIRFAWAEKYC